MTQELNPGLLHCRQILYHLSHQESLIIINRSNPIKNCMLSLLLTIQFDFQNNNMLFQNKVVLSQYFNQKI